MIRMSFILLTLCLVLLAGCDSGSWNHPHKAKHKSKNVYHASFSEPPKTLDPARSYSSNENLFTAQIYEPVLQYHYLKRPYTLVPLTAVGMPEVKYFKKTDRTVYTIKIKPGIKFQPHPAFAKDHEGNHLYHRLYFFRHTLYAERLLIL